MHLLYLDDAGSAKNPNERYLVLGGVAVYEAQAHWVTRELDKLAVSSTTSVQAIVVVTGDSDFIPAFKFARREGMRVFLCHLGHRIRRELMTHSDRQIRISLPSGLPVPRAPEQEAA